ncbi:MAG: hypothetical protein K2I70_02175, partial [Bacilli bacterium]|nr:hypothetical protein [Bacilli bacterium]
MKKLNESQLEDILDFENAIKKMYIRLADLEFNEKTDTDEYKIIIELLESARRIEKNKLDNIGIDEKTYDFILKFFTKDNDKTDIRYLLENQDFIEGIRLNNILNLIAMKNKAFIKEEDLKSPRYGKVLE